MAVMVRGFLPAIFLIWYISGQCAATAQTRPNSPVFRDYRPPPKSPRPQNPDIERQWNDLMLVRQANDGDPYAQHELGLRYLLGMGFAPDTARAAQWIRRAAEHGIPAAQYNYGLLLANGWGEMWNPFEAFVQFQNAAKRGMTEARYALGLYYTDNLVVPRNWLTAYRLISAAADSGYAPARETRAEMLRRHLIPEDTVQEAPAEIRPPHNRKRDTLPSSLSHGNYSRGNTSWAPIFLDFRRDTLFETINDTTILVDALVACQLSGSDSLNVATTVLRRTHYDSSALTAISIASQWGNPEATILLGRCLQRGVGQGRDLVAAAEEYIRAIYLDSPRAPFLFTSLITSEKALREIDTRGIRGDPAAQTVLGGMNILNMDHRQTNAQAMQMLENASDRGYIPALILRGILAASGTRVSTNREDALRLWSVAAREGSLEARVRIAAAHVLQDELLPSYEDELKVLREALAKGSIIAEVALAWCAESGRSLRLDRGEAARMYRDAAQRGSSTAYRALRRLYDTLRPDNPTYKIAD